MNMFKIILILMLIISVAQAANPTRYESGFILWGSGIDGYNQIIYNATIDQRNLTVNDTGLVLDMRFNENSTGAAIGTKIYDSSKYANDGIWYGSTAPGWSNGSFNFGQALRFDGSDDVIDVNSTKSITDIYDEGGTFEAWIKVNSDGELNQGRIFDKTYSYLYTSGQTSTAVKLTFIAGFTTTAGVWVTTNPVIEKYKWTHIVLTYSNKATTNIPIIYVNGVSVAVTVSQAPVGTRVTDNNLDLFIGSNSIGATASFDGNISRMRFWTNRTLSASDVTLLYYSNPLNEKSSFVQTDNFRVVNSSGKTTFNVSGVKTTVFNSIIPDTSVTNATLDIGAVGKSFNRIYATTFAGGDFADKAPGGYNYTGLWSWNVQYDINGTEIGRTPNIPQNIKYATVKLNPINGNWELAQGFGSIESTAIIPNDNDLIVDGRLIILGGYKAQVYGNITIGDKLIVSNRVGVLTNARGLTVPTLQYDAAWLWKNLPVSTDPAQYNRYNSAQGVSATIVAIALESYNSNNTGLINVKVFNT